MYSYIIVISYLCYIMFDALPVYDLKILTRAVVMGYDYNINI